MQVNYVSDGPELKQANEGDAGYDLEAMHGLILRPGERKMVPTGIRVQIPYGYVGLIHPRSGLAAKHGITVLNAPGTIDAGFRGEIKVILINHGQEEYEIQKGDRIAQIVFQGVLYPQLKEVQMLSTSVRGEGGFGSSGFNAHVVTKQDVVTSPAMTESNYLGSRS